MVPASKDELVRRDYARRIMQLATERDFNREFTVRSEDGSAPVVVALGHERVHEVIERITAAGGSANLFVVDSNERIHLVAMRGRQKPQSQASLGDGVQDVHHNITMDFLVLHMQQVKEGHLRVLFDNVAIEASREPRETEILLPA